MNQDEWIELKHVFAEACELEPTQRAALLDLRCAGKPRLRADVEEYLRYHADLARRPAPPLAQPRGELAGARIGRYRLVERIGEGGFGTVWLAEQEEPLKRLVALKLLKPGMDSKAVLARFDVERQSLALMDHPGIARIHDGGATEEGRPYFVMELVRGQPITRYCDEHGSSVVERLLLFREVCLAVQHAHYKGVIHRDLKPSNVLVSEQDGKPQPKVIDFGVAKATGLHSTQHTLATGIDQLIGTPDYMAPEQAAPGAADIDTRADVYALGVLLYELLTGTRPFDMRALLPKGLEEVLRTLREVEPQRPSARKPALAGDLDWLVLRALEKERAQRYPSAQDLADDITHFLRHEPLNAGPPSATYRLRKFVRRNRLGVAAVCAVGLALVAGTITTWRGYYVAEERRQLAERKTTEALESAAREIEQRKLAVAKEAEAQRQLERSEFFVQMLYDLLGSSDLNKSTNPDLKVSEMLGRFERDLASRLEREPDIQLGAHLILAHAYIGLGDAQRAGPNLDVARSLLPGRSSAAERVRFLQLEARRQQLEDNGPAAIELQRQAIQEREALGRPEGQLELTIQRGALAGMLADEGQVAEAESLARTALAELEASPTREPEAQASVTLSLAKILLVQGRPSEAESLLRPLLRSAPEDGWDRLCASVNLAAAVLRQGRFAEGEELLRDTGPRVRAALGEKHQTYRAYLMNLGFACVSQERLADAEAAYREALAVTRANCKPGSSTLVAPLYELGYAIFLQDRPAEAMLLHLEALEIRRAKNPGTDPDLASCLENVAAELVHLSRFEEAVPHYVELIELRRAALPSSRDLLDVNLIMYSEVLRTLGRFEQAEAALRERMQLYSSAAADQRDQRALALTGLGAALIGQERWADAEASLREAIQGFEAFVKPGNWALENARSLLGAALIGAGRKDEGAELLRSAAQRMRIVPLHMGEKRAALERLLHWLESSGQTDAAAECQARLDQLK